MVLKLNGNVKKFLKNLNQKVEHMVWEEHIVINIEMNKLKDPYQILQIWFSSSFPIGSYAYSHGLEALIDEKKKLIIKMM